MNINEIINEILIELSYRCDNGIVDLQNENQKVLLKEILSERFDDIVSEEIYNNLYRLDETIMKNLEWSKHSGEYIDAFIDMLLSDENEIGFGNDAKDIKTYTVGDITNKKELLNHLKKIKTIVVKGGKLDPKTNNFEIVVGQGKNMESWPITTVDKNKIKGGHKWSTPELEIGAVVGFYKGDELSKCLANLNSIVDMDDINTIKIIAKVKKDITAAYSSVKGLGDDDVIIDKVIARINHKDALDIDLKKACALGLGTPLILNKIPEIKEWNYVHQMIKEYYRLEAMLTNSTASKENTADVLFTNNSNLIKLMGTKGVTLEADESNNGIIDVILNGNKKAPVAKYIQVSLKASEKGAQGGKATEYVQGKYGDDEHNIKEYNDIISSFIESGIINEDFFGDIINTIKNAGTWIADKLKVLWNKFKSLVLNIKNKLDEEIPPPIEKSDDEWIKEIEADFGSIPEIADENNIEEKVTDNKNKLDVVLQKYFNNTTAKANIASKIHDVIETIKSYNSIYFKSNIDSVNASKIKSVHEIDDMYKIYANYRGLAIIRNMAKKLNSYNKNDVENIVNELIDLDREITFGNTKLPLWKVYGAENSGKDAKADYLGTKENYKKTIIGSENIKKKTLFLYCKAKYGTGPYMSVAFYPIFDVDGNGLKYSEITERTNASGRPSFVVEDNGKRYTYEKLNIVD